MSLSNILSCKNLLLIFLFFSSIFFLEFLFFLVLLNWMICKIYFPVIQLWTWVTQVDLLHRFGLNLCTCTVKSPIICSSWSYFSISSLKSCWEASKFPLQYAAEFFILPGIGHPWRYLHPQGIWCWCCRRHISFQHCSLIKHVLWCPHFWQPSLWILRDSLAPNMTKDDGKSLFC